MAAADGPPRFGSHEFKASLGGPQQSRLFDQQKVGELLMAMMSPINLEADYAITIRPSGSDVFQTDDLAWVERTNDWTGWIRRQWPADVVAPNRLLYAFDQRKEQRQLFALLRIDKGGTFSFRSMAEFAQAVADLIGHKPAPQDDEYSARKWAEIEDRVKSGKSCTGICYTLKVVKPVAIPLKGAFPQLGWCNLTLPNYEMRIEDAEHG